MSVLDDLQATRWLDHVLISEREGIEKPDRQLFWRACALANIKREETLHVGDELDA